HQRTHNAGAAIFAPVGICPRQGILPHLHHRRPCPNLPIEGGATFWCRGFGGRRFGSSRGRGEGKGSTEQQGASDHGSSLAGDTRYLHCGAVQRGCPTGKWAPERRATERRMVAFQGNRF